MKKTVLYVFVLILFSTGFSSVMCADASNVYFPTTTLSILESTGALIAFKMEVATTNEQLEHGLMYRHTVPKNTGMIFVFDKPQDIAMWMKNTFIPLDMLFVQPDGIIHDILKNTVPMSETILKSDEPTVAVIELGGGEADRLGIHKGDTVRYQAFARQSVPPPLSPP